MIRLSQKVLCLDWDRRSLRIVLAQLSRGRARLLQAHSVRIPAEVSTDEPEAFGKFIAECLAKHHCHARQVLVDVPRDRAVIKGLSLAPTPDSELADAVRLQAMKELPFPLEEAEIDFTVLQRDDAGRAVAVLLAGVLRKTLARVVQVCTSAGLKPARVGLRPYANLTSLRNLTDERAARTLFVDVGANWTEIDIVADGRLVFSRAVNIESPDPNNPTPVTEDSRILSASELDVPAQRRAHFVNDILIEITRSIQAHRATDPTATIDSIMVAGGTSHEQALRDAVAERLNLPCTLFDPRAALALRAKESERLRGFSAALGLAWGLGRSGQLAIDFLNPKRPIPRQAIRLARLRLLGLAAAAVVLAVTTYYVVQYQRGARELAVLKQQLNNAREEVRKLVEVQNMLATVQDWATAPVWPEELLRISDAAVEPGKQMLVQQLRLDGRTGRIDIRGVQADAADVPAKFQDNLNDPPPAVALGSAPTTAVARGALKPFTYDAQLGTWNQKQGGNQKFSGSVDVVVYLKELVDHLNSRAAREKDRKKKEREL
ncbi:MAG: pilus assembly protein PilM [Phycisphaerae bacterium]|nr:pilus assembly protein PilM [Phycisphaerae bacterium]